MSTRGVPMPEQRITAGHVAILSMEDTARAAPPALDAVVSAAGAALRMIHGEPTATERQAWSLLRGQHRAAMDALRVGANCDLLVSWRERTPTGGATIAGAVRWELVKR